MDIPTAVYGPVYPRMGRFVQKTLKPLFRIYTRVNGLNELDSPLGIQIIETMYARLKQDEKILIAGLNGASHNTGVALVECSRAEGIRILTNDEEERYVGKKHCKAFPFEALTAMQRRLEKMGRSPSDIHAWVTTWNYSTLLSACVRLMFEHAPGSFRLAREGATVGADLSVLLQALRIPKLLRQGLGIRNKQPVLMVDHHDCHAYLAYSASPFSQKDDSTLIVVIDGFGDSGAISIYTAKKNKLELCFRNDSVMDSLGILYGVISSTQGGWTVNSSEGRYMGAAAWGNRSRTTNPFYRQLRQMLYLGNEGQVFVNRSLAGWHLGGQFTPYKPALEAFMGKPIALEDMWNPDAVLDVDSVKHKEITNERVDKAAALQLVFEDALFHVVEYWVRKTGISRLSLSGGTALNCVANMSLVEQLNEAYFERYIGRRDRLQIWIPPTPGDAGNPMGAAIALAMRAGAFPAQDCMKSPYLCGDPPSKADIKNALQLHRSMATKDNTVAEFSALGNVTKGKTRKNLARLIAHAVANGSVVGVFQGAAETGPRALGNRSILADPSNPQTLSILNDKVKYRERIRPLAPMVTMKAAKRLFHLAEGLSENDYTAYDYMVLTVRAKELAKQKVPAVVHEDKTSRIQIVRADKNPLMYDFLVAMGELIGEEVSVNTSLNVGTPIVQTPMQAIELTRRAHSLDGVFFIDDEADAYVVWQEGIRADGTKSLMRNWLRWAGYREAETRSTLSQKPTPMSSIHTS